MNLTLATLVSVEWPTFSVANGQYEVTVHKGVLTWAVTDGVLLVEEYPEGATRMLVDQWDYLPKQTFIYPLTSVRRFRTEPASEMVK